MRQWMFMAALGVIACTGDATDTTSSGETADTGTEVPTPELTGIWAGNCEYPSKGKVDLTFQMALDEMSGMVSGFGTLSLTKGKVTGKTLGYDLDGTFDDTTGDVDLRLLTSQVILEFEGMLDTDTLAGSMFVVEVDLKTKKETRSKQSFACSFARQ